MKGTSVGQTEPCGYETGVIFGLIGIITGLGDEINWEREGEKRERKICV